MGNDKCFQKGLPTEKMWLYDARTNVPRITKKDRPLTPEYFKEFEKCFGSACKQSYIAASLHPEDRIQLISCFPTTAWTECYLHVDSAQQSALKTEVRLPCLNLQGRTRTCV